MAILIPAYVNIASDKDSKVEIAIHEIQEFSDPKRAHGKRIRKKAESENKLHKIGTKYTTLIKLINGEVYITPLQIGTIKRRIYKAQQESYQKIIENK